ncbi:MBL fold metallo-hydrolase, partial [Candidatus Gracilibacteria bacterium]|nr:MBL fold metallo-hydrolase [Candidatus Gracilibacteria bacterium]
MNFFDLKLGDGILIRSPDDKIILIDGGDGDQMISKISKKMGYFGRKIDYIFVTHYDSDHLTGLISIVKKFKIGTIFVNGKQRKTAEFLKFFEEIEKNNSGIIVKNFSELKNFSNCEKIFLGNDKKKFSVNEKKYCEKNFFLAKNMLLKPIFPIGNDFVKMKNIGNFSLVFEIFFKNSENGKITKILFTGDAEYEIEKILLEKNLLGKVDYLKIPHHGSKSSSLTGFILATSPKIGVIMASKDNKFGHPHGEIVERYKKFGVK